MIVTVSTVGELKKYLDTLDPKTPLKISAKGYDTEIEPTEQCEDGMQLDCFVSGGVLEIHNTNPEDMEYPNW